MARLPALREPAFRNLFAGQALSRLGDRIAPIALAFGVIEIGGSAADLGLVVAAGSIPFALFALAAGVWGDRLPRRSVMLASDGVRAVVQATAGTLLLVGSAEIWMLAALAAVYGTADAFFWPAMNGLLPETIESDVLQEANALLGRTQSVSNILGPVIAGILIAVVNPGGAILLDAGTFLVSIAFLLQIARPALSARAASEEGEGFLDQLRGGWREVRSRTWVWTGLIALASYHVIVLPAVFVLGPILAEQELNGASSWAIITAGFGVGSVVGQVLIYRLKFARPLRASFIAFVIASSPGRDHRLGAAGGRDRRARGGDRRRSFDRVHALGAVAAGAHPVARALARVVLRLHGVGRPDADRPGAGRPARRRHRPAHGAAADERGRHGVSPRLPRRSRRPPAFAPGTARLSPGRP